MVAAGHPATADAGAQALRAGGNAVDAAVSAVLASFAAESPLTGLGAGGFMLICDPARSSGGPGGEVSGTQVLVDFFVAAPGLGPAERGSDLVGIEIHFGDAVQVFNIGAASCGVPGTPAGLEHVTTHYGSMPLAELVAPAVRLARQGAVVTEAGGFLHEILHPVLTFTSQAAAANEPGGRPVRPGERLPFPDLADALERFGAEGAAPFYDGEIGRSVCEWVCERGGTLTVEDMAAYSAIERTPVSARFRGTTMLTNPPPSSGGVLIAWALAVLERLGDEAGVAEIVAATEAANALRTPGFDEALHDPAAAARLLTAEGADRAAQRIRAGAWAGGSESGGTPPGSPADRLGSTTHVAALDASGMCASVTCSNGTGSGLVVPGTGVHVNNMLGEEDLNRGGFHRIPAGRRVTSMMAPSAALRDGEVVLGLGSAGSNRIRSAILQVALRVLEQGLDVASAIEAGRIHFEDGVVQAEPGVSEEGLARVEASGVPVVRWRGQNLFFGGCQAVGRDPETGNLTGGGDPRRGGSVAFA